MRQSDTRLWKYVEPLIKCDYDLIIKKNIDKGVSATDLAKSRVQSIKINKKTGRLEVTVKCNLEDDY